MTEAVAGSYIDWVLLAKSKIRDRIDGQSRLEYVELNRVTTDGQKGTPKIWKFFLELGRKTVNSNGS